ncbi:PP2C family serine/threonine-protein phosphatase [Cytobacillus firmus]|uniref:PP2C family protein-serine/threonine phosphatase n=1 Tax=Cytobacillus firmus TaxID=1399 RepID=UPI0021621568|nr:protein phosphatase 2C domain-containing protein [Cytobacillus firmus]MCS0674502.1 protein phosphatase 2C domain-containing protein [Cytobacillus firmus]
MNDYFQIRVTVQSNIGKFRKKHEDNFLLDNGDYLSQLHLENDFDESVKSYQTTVSQALFAVSDGMGGHQSGEAASFLSVSKLSEMRNHILSAHRLEEAVNRYQKYISSLNSEMIIKSSMDKSLMGMGATLSTLILHSGHAIGIQVGDSRIYQYRQDELIQMTKDHTEGQRMLDLNLLTTEEVSRFRSSKELTRYVGMGDEYFVLKGDHTEAVKITDRTWFLLCSDGLTDAVEDADIQLILKHYFHRGIVEDAAEKLVSKALQSNERKKGGTDNITVMIVEILPV